MNINERYATQFKSYPDSEPERFMPMAAVGSGSYSLTAPPRDLLKLYGHYIYGERSDQNLITLYHKIPEIYSPIDAIARRVIMANIQLRNADDEVVLDNADWNRLYMSANPFQTFKEFLYEAVSYKYICGKNYAYKNSPNSLKGSLAVIAALWNLPADRVLPVYDYDVKLFSATTMADIIKYYALYDGINTGQFDTDKVLHSKSINLDWVDRRMVGKSPLLAADIALCNLIAVYESRNVIFTKSGAIGAIVSKKEDATGPVALSKKEKSQILSADQEQFGLTGGRSPYRIFDAPVEFLRMGMSIQELQPFDEASADMAAIYSVLNVPFDLAPNPKGSTFNNQTGAMRSMYTNTVIPEANRWMEALSVFLGFTAKELHLHADFSEVHELQENKQEQATADSKNAVTYRSMFLSGVITLNEWCAAAGYEQSTSPIYNVKVFDMTPEQLDLVTKIAKLMSSGTSTPKSNTSDNLNQQENED